MHRYKCASCGKLFKTKDHAHSCPNCYGRVLIHIEGDKPSAKKSAHSCCGNCSCGCGGH